MGKIMEIMFNLEKGFLLKQKVLCKDKKYWSFIKDLRIQESLRPKERSFPETGSFWREANIYIFKSKYQIELLGGGGGQ